MKYFSIFDSGEGTFLGIVTATSSTEIIRRLREIGEGDNFNLEESEIMSVRQFIESLKED